MISNACAGKNFFVLAVLAALFAPSLAQAVSYDELQFAFLTPQYFPYDAGDSTTKGNAIMISSTLSNPFGASVGADAGNNVNRVYLIISNAYGRASVGDLYFYQAGYYRKAPRTAETDAGNYVDYVYSTSQGVLPVIQSARILLNPVNGEENNPDYTDFVIQIPEKINAQGTSEGKWLFDVGGVNSWNPYFYSDATALTSDSNEKIWYSTTASEPQARSSPFTSPRGSIGTQHRTTATVKYALEYVQPVATVTPVATSAPTATPAPSTQATACVITPAYASMKVGESRNFKATCYKNSPAAVTSASNAVACPKLGWHSGAGYIGDLSSFEGDGTVLFHAVNAGLKQKLVATYTAPVTALTNTGFACSATIDVFGPTATVIPTPVTTSVPTPITTSVPTPIATTVPGSCSEMKNVRLPEGSSVTACGFTVKIVRYHGWEDYAKVDFEINGAAKLSARAYKNTYTTTEGGPALFLKFNDDGGDFDGYVYKAGVSGFDSIKPFEQYYRAMRAGQTARLADGTSVTLRSIAQGSDGRGSATFDIAGVASTGITSVTVSTNQEKQLTGRTRAHVFGVRSDGSVFVGFTPSTETPLSPGATSADAMGFDIGIIGDGDFVPASSDVNGRTLYREVHSCDGKRIGDSQAIPFDTGYGNIACENRYQEQCVGDGSFDAYYNEWCTGSVAPTTKPPYATIPPLPTSVPAVNEFKVKLNAGWNLVSTPVTDTHALGGLLPAFRSGGKIVETDCGANTLWHYEAGAYANAGKNEAGNVLEPMKGYWVYAPNACSMTLQGSNAVSVEGTKLEAGWNQIGGPLHPVSFNSVSRACSVLSGPWTYSAQARKYVKAGALQPGEAYFVRVSGACFLAETDDSLTPPALPQESESSDVSEYYHKASSSKSQSAKTNEVSAASSGGKSVKTTVETAEAED